MGIKRIEHRAIMPDVLENYSISISRIEAGVPNDAIGCGRYRRSIRRSKVDAWMIA
jgi:hypothetical protein